MEQEIDVPEAWQQLDLARLGETVLVIGAPDVGKSIFARYLYRRLCRESGRVAFLDGDPGQSTLGPPTTMTLVVNADGHDSFPPQGPHWRSFVGAVSPRGHMLPLVVGASRLVQAARQAGVETVVYDTCGLVDPAQGGAALKLAKIDLLQPVAVCAIQRNRELESLLVPLRRSRRAQVIDLRPSPAVRSRDTSVRQAHRASQFARYFAGAHPLTVTWTQFAVFPTLSFAPNHLVALEDERGFTLGLGVVTRYDVKARQVTLYTPLESLAEVDALHLGNLALDPKTFQEQHLPEG